MLIFYSITAISIPPRHDQGDSPCATPRMITLAAPALDLMLDAGPRPFRMISRKPEVERVYHSLER